MIENFDIREELFVIMTKKRLVSLMMSMGFVLVAALHNFGEKLNFGLQCLNLIGLCLFLFLMCTVIKDIRSDK